MKHIKYFEEKALYDNYISNDPILPNVSYTLDTNQVFYNLPKSGEKNYMYVEALEDDTLVLFKGLGQTNSSFYVDPYNTLEYSVDQQTWNTISADGTATTINTGEKLYFRGECTDIHFDESAGTMGIGAFLVTKKHNVGGNIMSLLFSDNFEDKIDLTGYDYVFGGLFINTTVFTNGDEGKLVSAENLLLPATTLTPFCYYSMFVGCTSLITPPQLPATTLADLCYGSMFAFCTSLTTTPELPATTLADSCYYNMFYSCTALVTATELSATELADSCYSWMFANCTSLVNVPSTLSATTLTNNCYSQMFYYCTSLTTAPKLPATKLEYECYSRMFIGCASLSNITMLATDISETRCLDYWVSSVASTGTFYKHPDMTSLPTGYNGIPSGWEVVDYNVAS